MRSESARDAYSLRFVLSMLLCYVAFYVIYCLVPDQVLRDVIYPYGLVGPSVSLLHWLAPAEDVATHANQLVSSRAVLEIVRGCDGSGVWFLVSAAMLAFPARWRYKVLGVLASAVLVYVLNLARLVGLYFAAVARPAWFVPLHGYFVPTLLIVIMCLFFMAWMNIAVRAGTRGSSLA